ncbi:MAG: hypothetical protein JWP54_2885 [Cryobacterium sp.]|nr:hypothetical protein [Cryobacterium sp.]
MLSCRLRPTPRAPRDSNWQLTAVPPAEFAVAAHSVFPARPQLATRSRRRPRRFATCRSVSLGCVQKGACAASRDGMVRRLASKCPVDALQGVCAASRSADSRRADGWATSVGACPDGAGRRWRSWRSRRRKSGRPPRGARVRGWGRCPGPGSGALGGHRPTARHAGAARPPTRSRRAWPGQPRRGQARCAGPFDPSVGVIPARAATRAATASGLLNSSKLCTRR